MLIIQFLNDEETKLIFHLMLLPYGHLAFLHSQVIYFASQIITDEFIGLAKISTDLEAQVQRQSNFETTKKIRQSYVSH